MRRKIISVKDSIGTFLGVLFKESGEMRKKVVRSLNNEIKRYKNNEKNGKKREKTYLCREILDMNERLINYYVKIFEFLNIFHE